MTCRILPGTVPVPSLELRMSTSNVGAPSVVVPSMVKINGKTI